MLASKAPWLNKVGWIVRAFLYLLVWAWIGPTFFRLSTSQDGTKDPKLTLRAQQLAPVATFLFGFTLTGAAFDWLMSLLPTWYSTIYRRHDLRRERRLHVRDADRRHRSRSATRGT